MARMPGVQFLGITAPEMDAHDIVCVHTIVGYQAGGTAAHFTTGASGKIVQARDTIYKSAANFNGNHRVIAIENEDHGPAYGSWSGSNVPRFTAAQAEAIAKILVWAHKVHGIPLSLIPDSKPGRRGVAYHRQGIDPWRVPGGELWTKFPGKVCPGDKRVAQLVNEIIPRARVLAGAAPAPTEDDMPLTAAEKQEIAHLCALEVWGYMNKDAGDTVDMHEQLRLAGWNYKGANDDRDMHQVLKDAESAAKSAKGTTVSGGIDYAALAKAINDDADKRQRDGNAATGPVS